jgi:predicted RNA binding protein YcfA (HicA-like mRNA interferase family)
MTKKQQRTLAAIFTDPVPANIAWHDVESLLVALGAQLAEARGSRLTVVLNDRKSVLHRPHPGNEVGKGMLRGLRGFLVDAGVRPAE